MTHCGGDILQRVWLLDVDARAQFQSLFDPVCFGKATDDNGFLVRTDGQDTPVKRQAIHIGIQDHIEKQ